MELFLLLFILLLFLWVFYRAFGSDITAPTFLMQLGYVITAIFALYNLNRWETKLHWLILPLIVLGLLSFGIGEFLCQRVRLRKHSKEKNVIRDQLSAMCLNPKSIKVILLIFFSILATVILYREVVRVAFSNYRDWGNLVYNYRRNRAETPINSIARISNYMTRAIAFVSLFAFTNNITENPKIRVKSIANNILLLVPGLLFIIQSLLLGGRLAIISYLVSFVVMLNLLIRFKRERWLKLDIGKLIKILILGSVFAWLFYYVQEFVGRQQVSSGALDYIATYLGGSIDLFSQYLHDPADIGNIETLAGIVDNAQRYLHILENVGFSTTQEFRYSATGVLIGNVYTGFRNYYHDGGIIGVVLFSFVLSVFFSGIYYSIKRYKRVKISRLALMIIYCSEAYCLLFHFFTDYFFLNISINKVINYSLIFVVTVFIFGGKLNARQRYLINKGS